MTSTAGPQTTWEYALAGADLLMQRYRQTLEKRTYSEDLQISEEAGELYFGPDRGLVACLIAAALHERMQHLGLTRAEASLVPLAAPRGEGATGTLRRRPYKALGLAPDIEAQGGAARADLLQAATSADPDDRLLWERVRSAALTVVDSVARETRQLHSEPRHPDAREDGTYWDRASTLEDVLQSDHQRAQWDRIASLFPED